MPELEVGVHIGRAANASNALSVAARAPVAREPTAALFGGGRRLKVMSLGNGTESAVALLDSLLLLVRHPSMEAVLQFLDRIGLKGEASSLMQGVVETQLVKPDISPAISKRIDSKGNFDILQKLKVPALVISDLLMPKFIAPALAKFASKALFLALRDLKLFFTVVLSVKPMVVQWVGGGFASIPLMHKKPIGATVKKTTIGKYGKRKMLRSVSPFSL